MWYTRQFSNQRLGLFWCITTTLSSFQRTISFILHRKIKWENNLSKLSKTFRHIDQIRIIIFLHRKEVIHPHLPVYLVTTSLQSPVLPSLAPSKRLGYQLRVLQTPIAWRAVCTTPGNVFTLTFWFRITSDSSFMRSSCRPQSELRPILEICSTLRYCVSLCRPL